MRPPARFWPFRELFNRTGAQASAIIGGKTSRDRMSSYSLVTPVIVMWPIIESAVAPCQ